MEKITRGTTNIFIDLGFADAAERQTKLKLALAINEIIRTEKFTQIEAATKLKVNQPKISALANYKLEGFSVERLMHFLTALDRDIEISITKTKKRKTGSKRLGEIRVAAA